MCPKLAQGGVRQSRAVFTAGGKRGEGTRRGNGACWTTFSRILVKLPSERDGPRVTERGRRLSHFRALPGTTTSAKLLPEKREEATMTATVAPPVVADGVGQNLFRNLANDKNRSYAPSRLSPLACCALRIAAVRPHLCSSTIAAVTARKRWKNCKTAGKLCSLTRIVLLFVSLKRESGKSSKKSRARDNARRQRMETYARRCGRILNDRKGFPPFVSIRAYVPSTGPSKGRCLPKPAFPIDPTASITSMLSNALMRPVSFFTYLMIN